MNGEMHSDLSKEWTLMNEETCCPDNFDALEANTQASNQAKKQPSKQTTIYIYNTSQPHSGNMAEQYW